MEGFDEDATVVVVAVVYKNWSEMLIELVVAPTVTVTSTRPPLPAGLVAEIDLSPLTVKQGALPHARSVVDPKATPVAPVNPLPRICTPVPPVAGPLRGLTPLTTGGPGVSKVNLSKH